MESFGGIFKIMLLGDTEIDTSSLFPSIFSTNTKLTTGVDIRAKNLVVDEKEYRLHIWDCSTKERFRYFLPTYCSGANAALLLSDVTRSQMLGNITEWVNIVRQASGDMLIMLIGIIPKGKKERRVLAEEGEKIAKSLNLNGFMECSIGKVDNEEKMFEDLVRSILLKPINENLIYNGLIPDIKIFVDVSESTSDKVVICQEIADKLGIKNGASIEVHNPDNGKKATAVIEISNMILDFAGQVSKNIVDSLDFMGVELILRPMS